MIYYIEHHTPLGLLTLSASERGLRGLYFEQHKYFVGPQGWHRESTHPHLRDTIMQLEEYFAGTRNRFDVPLDLNGTSFQRAVWQALLDLPFGHTTTYQEIAQRVGSPKAVRAAGTAIGRNPISIIVPCHRVVATSGGLSGYAGGLERKQYLLAHEMAAAKSTEAPRR